MNISTDNDDTLIIDLEDEENFASWHGEFSSNCKLKIIRAV